MSKSLRGSKLAQKVYEQDVNICSDPNFNGKKCDFQLKGYAGLRGWDLDPRGSQVRLLT